MTRRPTVGNARVAAITEVPTFFGLIKGSRTSIFKKVWKPDHALQATKPDKYTMAALLTFADDINPLGDTAPKMYVRRCLTIRRTFL